MFCGKTFYSKIEKNYHRTLKVIYSINDSYAAFYYAVTLSQFIEAYLKSIQNLCGRCFSKKTLFYNLRKGPILNLPRTQSTYYSTNADHFRGMEQSSY